MKIESDYYLRNEIKDILSDAGLDYDTCGDTAQTIMEKVAEFIGEFYDLKPKK